MEGDQVREGSADGRPPLMITRFGRDNRATMKTRRFLSCFFLAASFVSSCTDTGTAPAFKAGIQGRVYSIAAPGPTPVNWVPPPLERVSTVVVLDASRRAVFELLTDNQGRFSSALDPGTYYLRVKESLIPVETGPYPVRAGETVTVRADVDSGMR
jgi:hypothetical protein